MRRRTWALVRMCDVTFSHQVSLPSMIYEHDCDTQLPNNIFDDEFHPGSKELPLSRPNTEPTPISYMIAKSRLCNELGNILQATNDIGKRVPYDEIIRYDAKLRQILQELPPHLKLTSLEGTHDPVTLLIARFNVDILCQKIFCLLHRKYMPRARQNARYAHSRRSAIEASLRALDHLTILHKESQSNGRLRAVGWYVKSIATKDFTLPAMLVILDLHYDNLQMQSDKPQDHDGAFTWTPEQRSRMMTLLETCCSIWKTLADTSMEAFKASKIIEIMLQKIKNSDTTDVGDPADVMQADSILSGNTLSPNTIAQSMASVQPLPDFNMNAFPTQDTSAFMGMDFGLSPSGIPDFGGAGDGSFNAMGAPSPFSLFNTNGGAGGGAGTMPDLTSNFDWVSASAIRGGRCR